MRINVLVFFLFCLLVATGPSFGSPINKGRPFGGNLSFSSSSPISTPTPFPTPTVAPPMVIGAAAPAGGAFAPNCTGACVDPDPGQIADTHLFSQIYAAGQNAVASVAVNCPGGGKSGSNPSGCVPVHYIDFFINGCDTPVTETVYNWTNTNDEPGFIHASPGPIVSTNRAQTGTGSVCSNTNQYLMNPGDNTLNSYLFTTVWNGSDTLNDFPYPWAAMEDNASAIGRGIQNYSEFTQGPTTFANVVGTGTYTSGYDWETALGKFVAAACVPGTKCVPIALNALAPGGTNGNISACSTIKNNHCYAPFSTNGIIDDQTAIDNICGTATNGNLYALEFEEAIFSKSNAFMNAQTVTYHINTMANLVSHYNDGCANTLAVDIEIPGGAWDAAGTVAASYQIRMDALAFRWMVPNKDGMPDKIIPAYYTIGFSTDGSEIPYFFEDSLVPSQAEQSVSKFVWNGKTQSVGNNCPSSNSDVGGATQLAVQCVGADGSAVYCQQYQHLFKAQVDYGPMAVCWNTSSTTSATVSTSWFKHDSITNYNYSLALSGGEETSVAYPGVSGNVITLPCTNVTYCTGSDSMVTNTTTFNNASPGSYSLSPNSAMVFLNSN